jgi:WD40 repeat protein
MALVSLWRSLRWLKLVIVGTVLALTGAVLYWDRVLVSQPEPDAQLQLVSVSQAPGRATTGRCWVLKGSRYPIHALAFSSDGRLLAIEGGYLQRGGELRLWDAQSWKERAILAGHTGCVKRLAFALDSTSLVTSSFDETLRLWDVTSGQPGALFSGTRAGGDGLAFVAGGKRIVFCGFDPMHLMTWSPGVNLARRLGLQVPAVTCLDCDPLGQTLAVGTFGETETNVLLLQAATGHVRETIQGDGRAIIPPSTGPWHLAFSANGRLLAVVGCEGMIAVWDLVDRRWRFRIPGEFDAPPSVALSPDGSLLASGDSQGVTTLRDTRDGHELETRPAHTGAVTAIAFSPDGRLLTTASLDQTVMIWELAARIGHLPRPLQD